MEEFQQRAQVLIEAIPYIRSFHGKTFVIKYGGNAMINPEIKKAVMLDIILLKYLGLNPVIVHGGGPEISEMLKRVGVKSTFYQGLRVTDADTVEIVNMVLAGKINKELVTMINQFGGKAVGLSGQDSQLLVARKKQLDNDQVDLGFVGEVVAIKPELLHFLIEKSYIPVVATIGVGADGEFYNINADTVAGELAAALKAEKLIILTDTEGIYADPQDQSSLLSMINIEQARTMIHSGQIEGGMVPKVEACIYALQHGVNRTHIIDGRRFHTLLLEVLTDQGIGTMVVE
ncbi:MAG TPA: acetylglutamate kinase [Firmicutes bacterium]|nr:acetylglutamate kinase [Bacillota bacterium]